MANCLLVYVPGLPLRVEHLLPQEELASVAGGLRAAGHGVEILDLGTVCGSTAEYVSPHRRLHLPFLRARKRPGHAHVNEVVARLNSVLGCARGGVDLVAYLVKDRDGLAMSTRVNEQFQGGAHAARAVCFGPYVEQFAPYISAFNPAFDATVAETPEATLAALLESLDLPQGCVPGMVVREPEGAVFTGHAPRAAGGSIRSLPDYSDSAYPQLHAGEKLRFFPIHHAPNASAPPVMARVRQVRQQFPGAGIHFCLGAARPEQVVALAKGMASPRLAALGEGPCAMTLSVAALNALEPAMLRAMHCSAVALEVHTGSQRLLDDFFRAGFTVSEVEQAVRIARAGGASVAMTLTGPCPWDDMHTEAETLRLLQRTRPEAVLRRAPALTPGSPWYAEPARFGFRLQHRRLARWAACANVRDEAMQGEDAALAVALEALGAASGCGVQELALARRVADAGAIGQNAAALRALITCASAPALRGTLETLNRALSVDDTAPSRTQKELRHARAVIGN